MNMPRDSSFHDYVVHDLLGDVLGVTSRAMFSGWALYKEGVTFGIIIGSEVYLKIGDSNRGRFEAIGSHPFVYSKKDGRTVTMSSYWLVTAEAIDDKERFLGLVESSFS